MVHPLFAAYCRILCWGQTHRVGRQIPLHIARVANIGEIPPLFERKVLLDGLSEGMPRIGLGGGALHTFFFIIHVEEEEGGGKEKNTC